MIFKRITILLSELSAIALVLCSCAASGNTASTTWKDEAAGAQAQTGVVAQNGNFQLLWDNEAGAIFLVTRSGKVWSSVPYDYYTAKEQIPQNPALLSPVTVTYIDPDTNALKISQAAIGVYEDGHCNSRTIDNGIRVEYYFEQQKIMVPVEYLLLKDGLEARIPVSDLREAENRIYKISLLPFISSAPNDSDSFLFVPSGSGAEISVETKSEACFYSEAVYGDDVARTVLYKDSQTNGIRLPVFGVKDRDNALLGIVEQGAESAFIEAQAGDSNLGYSSVYASFQIRGEEDIEFKNIDNVETKVQVFSQEIISRKYVSVKYIPVLGEDNGIIGMANTYRDYLIAAGMQPSKQEESSLYITVLGGATAKSSFLGIPYRALRCTTTLMQAKDIISEISTAVSGGPITVNLMGFGSGGTDPDKVGGGFKIASKLGSVSELERLCKECESAGDYLYFDFDLIRFNKSGGGYSVWSDTAKSANSATAKKTEYLYSTLGQDSSYPEWYLLSRSKLPGAGGKLLKTANKWKLNGISAATLSSFAYSDGRDVSYTVKGNMAQDVTDIIKNLHDNKKSFLGVAPNAYAAMYSDSILAPPSHSGEWDCISEDIPFYQIVFKGSIPISSASLNLSANMRTEILRGISVGAAPAFTVYNTYDSRLRKEAGGVYMACDYSALSSVIIETANEAADFLSQVNGASVTGFSRDGEVTVTTFSNGITVYVNFSDTSVNTPIGSVESEHFIYGRVNEQ